jgi:hypothetical protein
LLVEKLTLKRLLAAIEAKNPAPIKALAFDDGTKPFDASAAADILTKLGDPSTKFALERMDVHDLPRLLVTKRVERDGKAPEFVTRDFSRLSMGQ